MSLHSPSTFPVRGLYKFENSIPNVLCLEVLETLFLYKINFCVDYVTEIIWKASKLFSCIKIYDQIQNLRF